MEDPFDRIRFGDQNPFASLPSIVGYGSAFENLRRSLEDSPGGRLARFERGFRNIRSQMEPFYSRWHGDDLLGQSSASLSRHLHDLEKICNPFSSFAGSSILSRLQETCATSITRLLEEGLRHRLPAEDPVLFASICKIPKFYSDYYKNTFYLLEHVRTTHASRAMTASLYLADDQLTKSSDAVISLLGDVSTLPAVQSVPSLSRLPQQRQELVEADQIIEPEDTEEARSKSITATKTELARQAVELVTRINEAAKLAGLPEEVFKPTTRMIQAAVDLQHLVPSNQLAFGHFLDCLYFILYEGAGEDRLRFCSVASPLMTDAECEIVWSIKVLRNKWARHDPDHGKPSDVRRSYRRLAATLEGLGLDGLPQNQRQYLLIHGRLLQQVLDFLTQLHTRVTGLGLKTGA